MKKIIISRYDQTIKEPPYLTIPFDEMLVEKPKEDYLGEKFYEKIRNGCTGKGYQFRFYTMSSNPDFDYEVIVIQILNCKDYITFLILKKP